MLKKCFHLLSNLSNSVLLLTSKLNLIQVEIKGV